MLNIQNFSPRKLAAFTAFCLSIPVSVSFYLVTHDYFTALLSFLVNFAVSYLLFHYVLDAFIFRKIKLIYKFIFNTKASRKEEVYYKYILPRKSIDEVREDVEKWADKRREEIEVLKSNENYRREFLQNLSHEFKTPIFSIQGYVESLLEGAVENPELRKKFLSNTHRNIERIVELVNDLDEITKLESGEKPLNKENFVIQDLIKEVFESLSLKMAKHEMTSSIKKGCETPVYVYADREKIAQVLTNIVDNAIQYGTIGGDIVASVYQPDEKRVLIEISDNGMGIQEEYLPRIFERFYRTDNGRTRYSAGSGLGLSICKHIIEAHGHAIHARSKPAVGTTIGFTLDERKD